MRSFRILAVVVLSVVLVVAPYGLGSAQASGAPYWDLEQNGLPVTTLQVAVGSTFTIDVWIRGIPSGDGLTDFYLVVTWDPAMMTLESYKEAANTHNWDAWHVESIMEDSVDFYAVCGYGGCPVEYQIAEGAMPLSLTFRCLAQGSSPVAIRQDAEVSGHLTLVSGRVEPPAFVLTCNQHVEAVGGRVLGVNKTALVSWWLAIVVVGCVGTVVVIAEKRFRRSCRF